MMYGRSIIGLKAEGNVSLERFRPYGRSTVIFTRTIPLTSISTWCGVFVTVCLLQNTIYVACNKTV